MKKKDFKPIKKTKKIIFGKFVKKKKYKLIAKIFAYRSYSRLKLKKIFYTKYNTTFKYFKLFKELVFKKEFFFFKNFFLKINIKNNKNTLLFPQFIFEKQFLFKFSEYQTVLFDLTNNSMFLKKKYGYFNNPGLDYLVSTNNNIDNVDPKDPVLYIKSDFDLDNGYKNEFSDFNFLNFKYNLNLNIFFFFLLDFYKIVLFLNFKNIVN